MSLKDLFGSNTSSGASNDIKRAQMDEINRATASLATGGGLIDVRNPWTGIAVQGGPTAAPAPSTDDTVTIRIRSCANGKTITLGGEVWVAAESDDILPIIAAALASAKLK